MPEEPDSLKSHMIRSGWCPHQAERFSHQFSAPTFQFVAQVPRSAVSRAQHRDCAENSKCVANRIDMSQYQARHVDSFCNCPMIEVPRDLIANIISSGGVPLIEISHSNVGGELHLRVHKRSVRSRYIAISHVWSDGLGNTTANALPTCQLIRLKRYTEHLPPVGMNEPFTLGSLIVDPRRGRISTRRRDENVQFWMDTLCIPVAADLARLRIRAINQMASIYAAAAQVLILDSELQQLNVLGLSVCNVLVRILACTWMRRSWTFQEGALARECVYQFKDASIDPIHTWCFSGYRVGRELPISLPDDQPDYDIFCELYRKCWMTLLQEWKSALITDQRDGVKIILPDFIVNSAWFARQRTKHTWLLGNTGGYKPVYYQHHFEIMTSPQSRLEQFVRVWHELGTRSTTKPEDIHVIFANLLDFLADTVLRYTSGAERMKAILMSFDQLPFALMYNTDLRTGTGPNAWMPSAPSNCHLSTLPVMTLTAHSLNLIYDSTKQTIIQIDARSFTLDDRHLIIDLDDEEQPMSIRLHCNTPLNLQSPRDLFQIDPVTGIFAATALGYTGPLTYELSLCVVLDGRLGVDANPQRGALFHITRIASILDRDGLCVDVTYVCPISATHYVPQTQAEHPGIRLNAKLMTSNLTLSIRLGDFCPIQSTYQALTAFIDRSQMPLLKRRPVSPGQSLRSLSIATLASTLATGSIGCLVAFGILKYRRPSDWTTRMVVLLAIGVSTLIGDMLIIFGIGLLSMHLSYRSWLTTFDGSWDERSRSWWMKLLESGQGMNRYGVESLFKSPGTKAPPPSLDLEIPRLYSNLHRG